MIQAESHLEVEVQPEGVVVVLPNKLNIAMAYHFLLLKTYSRVDERSQRYTLDKAWAQDLTGLHN